VQIFLHRCANICHLSHSVSSKRHIIEKNVNIENVPLGENNIGEIIYISDLENRHSDAQKSTLFLPNGTL
jgi:hypothetical protein